VPFAAPATVSAVFAAVPVKFARAAADFEIPVTAPPAVRATLFEDVAPVDDPTAGDDAVVLATLLVLFVDDTVANAVLLLPAGLLAAELIAAELLPTEVRVFETGAVVFDEPAVFVVLTIVGKLELPTVPPEIVAVPLLFESPEPSAEDDKLIAIAEVDAITNAATANAVNFVNLFIFRTLSKDYVELIFLFYKLILS
jgi:hypothetical protein